MVVAQPRQKFKFSIFLSYPRPYDARQQDFIDHLCDYLDDRGFAPRTLGVTDYDLDAPLKAIRRLMLESNGLITVALRRTYLKNATSNFQTNVAGVSTRDLSDTWLTSPWAHIEPAMAYQIGLPIMILRESGVVQDGILERGVVGTYMPTFDVAQSVSDYLSSPEWKDLIGKWEGQVRSVVDKKGSPPTLY